MAQQGEGMTQPTELKPGDRVCWMKSSPRSTNTMSLTRREAVLVQHKENGVSEVRSRNGKRSEVATDRLHPISADPLRNFTEALLESAQGKRRKRDAKQV